MSRLLFPSVAEEEHGSGAYAEQGESELRTFGGEPHGYEVAYSCHSEFSVHGHEKLCTITT